jgi:signal transduction histidine kinase
LGITRGNATTIQKISGPIEQADWRENSTDLGLSITFELVKALRSQISVESGENKGSKFIVQLPLNI